MHRTIIPTLRKANTDAPRQRVTAKGKRGQIPPGENFELEKRIRDPRLLGDAAWEAYKRNFTTIRCKVKGVYLGSNEYPDNPLFSLRVTPLSELPTTRAPNSDTPWHISIEFFDPAQRQAFTALEQKYSKTRNLTLRGWIQGLAFYLDTSTDPIGSDPLVQEVHAKGHYRHKPLHISL